MSKERELLGRAMSLIDYRYAPSEAVAVHREIEELLAQPEQEQEPVAWGYKKRVTYKPEGSEEEEIIPLYTAPPKREPLSDDEITTNTPKTIPIGERLAFHAGIRWAEHKHGIGGGE